MAAPVMNNSAGLSLYAALSPRMALLSGRVCLHTWAFMKYLPAPRLFTFKANEFVH